MKTTPSISSRPRVLHCITRLGLGGAEAVALSIVRGLQHEFEFGVFAVKGSDGSTVARQAQAELARLEVPVFFGTNLPIKLGGMLLGGWHLGRAAAEFRPALLHVHTEIPESAYAVMARPHSAPASTPLVRTIHNSEYWHFWPRLGRWCERRMPQSHVACVSEDTRTTFLRHRAAASAGPLPTPPVVIYNGVLPPASDRPVRSADSPRRVLFAGRFEPQKGTDLIPEILRLTAVPAGGCELVCHGQGAHEPLLRSLAAKPPSGWRIEIAPPVPDLPQLMRQFDVVIMPSRYEGLGLVAVEAVLAGVPIVATDATGLREVLPADYPGRARLGDLADFAQRLQAILGHPSAWDPAVAAAAQFGRQRFDLQKMLAGYRRLYAQAGASSGPRDE